MSLRVTPILALTLLSLPAASAGLLLSETFATDPVGSRAIVTGSPSRFAYSTGEMVADYDLLEPHARLAWPLTRALTESDSFTVTFEFTLRDVDFDPFSNFCQLSFGLINQANTGPRRTESPGDSWECLTIDYFPGAFPSYTPTFIRQQPPAGGDPLNDTYLKFPDGPASLIADFDEIGNLPEDTRLTTVLRYDAGSQMITVSLADNRGGLLINNELANPDGDESTIQLGLDSPYPFELDAFALLLWDHFQGGTAELVAHSIIVETPVVEPIDLLAEAFPEGGPSPTFEDGRLEIIYLRDLTKSGFMVTAERSADLEAWLPATHSVLSAGPGYEIRAVSAADGFLRLRVTAQ